MNERIRSCLWWFCGFPGIMDAVGLRFLATLKFGLLYILFLSFCVVAVPPNACGCLCCRGARLLWASCKCQHSGRLEPCCGYSDAYIVRGSLTPSVVQRLADGEAVPSGGAEPQQLPRSQRQAPSEAGASAVQDSAAASGLRAAEWKGRWIQLRIACAPVLLCVATMHTRQGFAAA